MGGKAMNLALKWAIIQTGRHQWEIAREAGIHEARLSKFIRGYGNLNDGEIQRLEAVLGVPVEPTAVEGGGQR
jgi:plasmid maintenance system antidote protein VapI